jgi:hypothetical protein
MASIYISTCKFALDKTLMGSLISHSTRQIEDTQDADYYHHHQQQMHQKLSHHANESGLSSEHLLHYPQMLDDSLPKIEAGQSFHHDILPLLQPIAQQQQQQYHHNFTKQDVELKTEMVVYCSGPHRNAETTKVQNQRVLLHVFTKSNYLNLELKRWDPCTFVSRMDVQVNNQIQNIVKLQRVAYPNEKLHITWHDFTENFTPYNMENSNKSQNNIGSFFTSSDWIAQGLNSNKSVRQASKTKSTFQ